MLSVRKSILFGLATLSFAPAVFANVHPSLIGTLDGRAKKEAPPVPRLEAAETNEMESKRLHFLNTHIGTQFPFSNPVTWQAGRFMGTFELDSEKNKNGSKGRFQKLVDQKIHCLRYTHTLSLRDGTWLFAGRGTACLENDTWVPANTNEVFPTGEQAPKADPPAGQGQPTETDTRVDKKKQTRVEELAVPHPGELGLDHTYNRNRNMISKRTLGDLVQRLTGMRRTLKKTLEADQNLPTMAESSKVMYLQDVHTSWARYYAGYMAWGLAATGDRAAIPAMIEGRKSIALDQLLILMTANAEDFQLIDEAKVAFIKVFLGFEWDATTKSFSRKRDIFSRIDVREGSLASILELIKEPTQKAELARAFRTAVEDEDEFNKRTGDAGKKMMDYIRADVERVLESANSDRRSKPARKKSR